MTEGLMNKVSKDLDVMIIGAAIVDLPLRPEALNDTFQYCEKPPFQQTAPNTTVPPDSLPTPYNDPLLIIMRNKRKQ